MYNGFTTSQEQDRNRWQLMQKRAAKQAKRTKPASKQAMTQSDRFNMALAIKRQQEG